MPRSVTAARPSAKKPKLPAVAFDSHLPTDLIDIICRHVEGFFGEHESRERAAAAVYEKTDAWMEGLGKKKTKETKTALEYLDRQLAAESRDSQKELARILDKDEHWVEKQSMRAARARTDFDFVRQAYCGWLITNPDYHIDLQFMKERWHTTIHEAGGFPSFGTIIPRTAQVESFGPACYSEFAALYQRWSLRTLYSWDLPCPSSPQFDPHVIDVDEWMNPNGIAFILPWNQLRANGFDFGALVWESTCSRMPTHLREWVFEGGDFRNGRPVKKGTSKTKSGTQGHWYRFWLYWKFELAILRRFPAACKGNLGALDRAFAKWLDAKDKVYKSEGKHSKKRTESFPESIRRTRLKLKSDLQRCREESMNALESGSIPEWLSAMRRI